MCYVFSSWIAPPHRVVIGGRAAAILLVRCQYFLNVTGFLGVDSTISRRSLGSVHFVQV